MTTRRGFLANILASGIAPAVVGSSILMPVKNIVAPSFTVWGTKQIWPADKGFLSSQLSESPDVTFEWMPSFFRSPTGQLKIREVSLTSGSELTSIELGKLDPFSMRIIRFDKLRGERR